LCEMRRATIWQIITIDGSQNNILQFEILDRSRNVRRLFTRVQSSPIIMKVAVPPPQHSPTFGQCASSHTVCSEYCFISSLSRA
jgi:hypothetical protein